MLECQGEMENTRSVYAEIKKKFHVLIIDGLLWPQIFLPYYNKLSFHHNLFLEKKNKNYIKRRKRVNECVQAIHSFCFPLETHTNKWIKKTCTKIYTCCQTLLCGNTNRTAIKSALKEMKERKKKHWLDSLS